MSEPGSGNDANERPRRYIVVEAERIEKDKERAAMRLLRRNPDHAAQWLASLDLAIADLAGFPGPRSHAVDDLASNRFGLEVRRMLYYGLGKRRSGTPYRILFTVIEPAPGGESEGIIRVLRILHGASDPFGPEPGSEESA